MRVIEVKLDRASFADTLGEMREWLDRNTSPLVRFETAVEERGGIMATVEFDSAELAELFWQAFGGSYGR